MTASFAMSGIVWSTLHNDVLQYGFNNYLNDWIKGGCYFGSWIGFIVAGSTAYHMLWLSLENEKKD